MWWRGGGGKKHWQSDKPKRSSHHTEEDDYMYSGGRGSAPSALHSRRPPALAHDVGHPEQLSSHREGPPRFGGDWLHDKRKRENSSSTSSSGSAECAGPGPAYQEESVQRQAQSSRDDMSRVPQIQRLPTQTVFSMATPRDRQQRQSARIGHDPHALQTPTSSMTATANWSRESWRPRWITIRKK